MRYPLTVAALAALFVPAVWAASAQTPQPADPGDTPAIAEIEYQGYVYDYATGQPLIAHVLERRQTLDGEWVVFVPFVRLPSGEIVPLTPCDGSLTCVPVTTRADAALVDAAPGEAFVLVAAEDER